ncbi:MAG TPA: DNA translocase FtsK [Bacillota bacterium]|nr:DNA translocase FtsK [Bacillota bacterium]HOK69549.1 DNA translocase FtsK [Bacillota bacterium]
MAASKKSKKSTSSKKYTAKKEAREKKKPNPFVPYIIGFFAVFLILTFFLTDSGLLGEVIPATLLGLFGPGYYYFPFLLLLIAFYWKRDSANGTARSKVALAIANFILLLVIIHAFTAEQPDSYADLYKLGQNMEGAGLIGGLIGASIVNLLGKIPTLILTILSALITVIFLFGSTPKATLKAIVDFFRSLDFSADEDDEKTDADKNSEPAAQKKTAESAEADEQKKFELPDVPASKPAEKDIVNIREINREKPWQQPVSAGEPGAENEDAGISIAFNENRTESAQNIHFDADAETDRADGEDAAGSIQSEELRIVGEKPQYVFPPMSLLADSDEDGYILTENDLHRTSQKLVETLESFGVRTKVISASCGPTVTRYELQPETGVRVKSIANLADDIALHLAATSVRIESIPGKAAVGIEIPNKSVSTVRLRGLLENPTFKESKSKLFVALGVDIGGNPVYLDIAKMPHLLIAGATGMGKSVCINSLLISLLYRATPDEVKLICIDPKRIELTDYNGIPHLMVPVITEPKKAAGTLNWACIEMEKRYTLIQEVGARNLAEYNATVKDDPEREQLPYVVIVIDELADLMMTAPDDVETSICRLAQKARAAGMHLIIGTQRPSVDVITGLIKANIPSRIAFTVASQVDSRTILDMAGAEKLLGRGDMLYYPVGAMKPIRVQGAFVDGKTEVTAVTQFIKEAAEVQYNEDVMNIIEQEAKLCGVKHSRSAEAAEEEADSKDDPMIVDALEVALECGNISTSLLQRRLSLGYARAARIVDKLERRGYIGQFDPTTKKRQILITREEFMELKLNSKKDE